MQQKAGQHKASQSLLKLLLTGALRSRGYRYQQAVGEGGFGTNFSIKKGEERFALKFQYADGGKYTLKRELDIMKKLHEDVTVGSKFLIKPVDDIEEIVGVTAILTPYYGKTLEHYVQHIWKGREQPIKRLAKGLCLGLKHMHDHEVAHRDIKSANILL